MAVATVIYPNDNPDAEFNLDYYLSTHMPLVSKHWGPLGLKEWRITRYDEGLGGSSPPYRILASLHFDSIDSIRNAVGGKEAEVVFGDVPNFTNITPVFSAGGEVGSEVIGSSN